MVPTMERERTTIPRTTPKFLRMRKPGRSNVVVMLLCGTIDSSRAPVDVHLRRVWHFEALLQGKTAGGFDRLLGIIAGDHHGPRLVLERVRPL